MPPLASGYLSVVPRKIPFRIRAALGDAPGSATSRVSTPLTEADLAVQRERCRCRAAPGSAASRPRSSRTARGTSCRSPDCRPATSPSASSTSPDFTPGLLRRASRGHLLHRMAPVLSSDDETPSRGSRSVSVRIRMPASGRTPVPGQRLAAVDVFRVELGEASARRRAGSRCATSRSRVNPRPCL